MPTIHELTPIAPPTGPGLLPTNEIAVAAPNAQSVDGYTTYKTTGAALASLSASSAKTVASPTAPASTSVYAMQGLAGLITPATSGTVLIIISGTIIDLSDTTVDNGILYQISYGTGSAPANADALTGTQIGLPQSFTLSAAATAAAYVSQPFSTAYLVTGLTVGTAYWIDLAAESVTTASQMGLANVQIVAVEK